MRTKLLQTALLFLAVLLMLPAACTPSQTTTTPGIPSAPDASELESLGFVSPHIPRVSCEELKFMMDNEEDFVLVDTRFKLFYDEQHLPGAVFIQGEPTPLLTQQWIDNQLKNLPQDKTIVFYCD
ncbi:MAG: rhodanese-like domain-containing protein [Dehalococcoidales bacterium]|jgi:hypothetical protein|nr:rhodanese-like domain-containing protein [Dehalococcoidales bacterium]MDD3265327.1 rhodanese-like domain-containing protein [Dehalococcoidales bacterium]MDD4322899.1 rhodanese-like domain-containing protein [Dehalococcoidales bacterium]MDD4794727.1 rhodanese-like domain-containing protein [Dehalococcoidales bacterium]MDD5122342.1 rhodanese-like domain-containing protein [Dehalococcoidales bacterium]